MCETAGDKVQGKRDKGQGTRDKGKAKVATATKSQETAPKQLWYILPPTEKKSVKRRQKLAAEPRRQHA
jgi:hypothetical protein